MKIKNYSAMLALILINLSIFAQSNCPSGALEYLSSISEGVGGFEADLAVGERFGVVASIGDLNDDGVRDLAVGSPFNNSTATNAGAVWILFMNQDGSVVDHYKIGENDSVMSENLLYYDEFGNDLDGIGDLDGDGIEDIAVCAYGSNNTKQGKVWILFLNRNGSVKHAQQIGSNMGGFNESIFAQDRFGTSIACMGDSNGDDIVDIAVGAWDDGTDEKGCVWILNLTTTGIVDSYQKITNDVADFGTPLESGDRFGRSIGCIGDIDADGNPDLAVCAYQDNSVWNDNGALYIIRLDENQNVISYNKIYSDAGGFEGDLTNQHYFGFRPTMLGDINNDESFELLVVSFGDKSKLWMLSIDELGFVLEDTLISDYIYSELEYFDENINFGKIAVWTENPSTISVGLGMVYDDYSGEDVGSVHLFNICKVNLVDISGSVLANGINADGWVLLYNSEFENVASVELTNGNFLFEEIVSGIYTLVVIPEEDLQETYSPTYLGDADDISNATFVNFTADTSLGITNLIERYFSVEGTIHAANEHVDGQVYLYSSNMELLLSTETEGGYFVFDSVTTGDYFVSVLPKEPWSENYLQTFYGNVLLALEAQSFNVMHDILEININLIRKYFAISGTVHAGGSYLESGRLILYDANSLDDTTMIQSIEIVNGIFATDYVPKGDYVLLVVPIGEDANVYQPTFLGETHNIEDAHVLTVDTTITRIDFTNMLTYTAIAEYSSSEITVSPVPAVSNITISGSEIIAGLDYAIAIYDCGGKQLVSKLIPADSNSDIIIDVAKLPVGIFSVWIEDEEKTYNQIFIKE